MGYDLKMTDTKWTIAANGIETLSRLLHSHPETAYDYLEFRNILAGEATAFAAERATDADLARIKECLDQLKDAHSRNDPLAEAAADADFHLSIYDSAKNSVMTHIMRRLFEMLSSGVFYDRAGLRMRRGVRENFMTQHQKIYEAIAARNPEAARIAAQAHIISTREALLEAKQEDHRLEVSKRRQQGSDLVVRRRVDGSNTPD